MPSYRPVGRQQRLKAPPGTARARIVAAEFLEEFLVAVDGAVTALDPGLAKGSPCGVCWSAQKLCSLSSRYMTASSVGRGRRTRVGTLGRLRRLLFGGARCPSPSSASGGS
jgi:hypothetical protein